MTRLAPGSVLTEFCNRAAETLRPTWRSAIPLRYSLRGPRPTAAIQSRLKGTEAGVGADRGAQDNFEIDGQADDAAAGRPDFSPRGGQAGEFFVDLSQIMPANFATIRAHFRENCL